ncbi:ATP-grasp domain-containing protein [Longispora urticae]
MTEPHSRVGVVHGPWAAATVRDIVTAARGVCEPVVIFRRGVADSAPALVAMTRALARVEIVGDERTTEEIVGLGLDGCTTFHDGELETVDRVHRSLGLPGAGGVDGAWDKLTQRRTFLRHGVSALRAVPVDSREEFHRAVGDVGLPAVLKPRRSVAGTDLALLPDASAVAEEAEHRENWHGLVFEQFIARGAHPSGLPWLADYVSVETVSDGATRCHVAVLDKPPLSTVAASGPARRNAVRETGDFLPSQLPPDRLRAVLDRTGAALDALGVRSRVTHTELRVTDTDVDVIEVNGRLGGEVQRLLDMVGGPNLVRAALVLALGGTPDLSADWTTDIVSVLSVPFPDRAGTVRSGVTRPALRALPGVEAVDAVALAGDARSVSDFRTASLVLRARDAGEMRRALGGVLSGVAELFAEDGLDRDPWLRAVLAGIADPGPLGKGSGDD